MILIIGGSFQGKLAFAERRYEERFRQRNPNVQDGTAYFKNKEKIVHILNGFEELVLCWRDAGMDSEKAVLQIMKDHPDLMIICDEVGSGIVPMKQEERAYREAVGRCCGILAKASEEVYRVICGIETRIK